MVVNEDRRLDIERRQFPLPNIFLNAGFWQWLCLLKFE